jgi:hypothetical protein
VPRQWAPWGSAYWPPAAAWQNAVIEKLQWGIAGLEHDPPVAGYLSFLIVYSQRRADDHHLSLFDVLRSQCA